MRADGVWRFGGRIKAVDRRITNGLGRTKVNLPFQHCFERVKIEGLRNSVTLGRGEAQVKPCLS